MTAGAGGGSHDDSDLGRATRLAMQIETALGLGTLGLISLPGDPSDLLTFEPLRTAVGSTLDRAYVTALEILARNRHTLDALTTALLSRGYLDQVEIEAVLLQAPLCSKAVTDTPTPRRPKQPDAACQTDANATDTRPKISPDIVTSEI